jgi:hypothetical protein
MFSCSIYIVNCRPTIVSISYNHGRDQSVLESLKLKISIMLCEILANFQTSLVLISDRIHTVYPSVKFMDNQLVEQSLEIPSVL